MQTQQIEGIEEFEKFGRALAEFSENALAPLSKEIIPGIEAMYARLKGPMRDKEIGSIVHTLKSACPSLNKEIADMVTNIQVIYSLQMTIATALARLNVKFDAMRAEAEKQAGGKIIA